WGFGRADRRDAESNHLDRWGPPPHRHSASTPRVERTAMPIHSPGRSRTGARSFPRTQVGKTGTAGRDLDRRRRVSILSGPPQPRGGPRFPATAHGGGLLPQETTPHAEHLP